MKALGPIPSGFEAGAQGRLQIGGWDVEALVGEAGGTPMFVYDTRRIADQVARFRSTPTLSVGGAAAAEDAGVLSFPVTLSRPIDR